MILVTGGTGAIGSELLRLLSQAGIPARALTRNLDKAQKLPGIEWVVGDLARPATLATSFAGAKTYSFSHTISKTWWHCSTTPLLQHVPRALHTS